jgi:urocanate hydratase
MGVIQHSDAGYITAQETAKAHNLNIADRLMK